MKRTVIILATVLIAATQAVHAKPAGPGPRTMNAMAFVKNFDVLTPGNEITAPYYIQKAFEDLYPASLKPTWRYVNGVYLASFTRGSENVTAYFNEDGELIGTAKYISPSNLPAAVRKTISDEFGDSYIRSTVVSTLDGLTNYYLMLENNKRTVYVRIDELGSYDTVKLIKKKAKNTVGL